MDNLAGRIKRLGNAFERAGNRMLKKQGLTLSQADILRLVAGADARGEALNQKAIEDALRLKNPTVTGTISRLEAKGLVRREGDPSDGRRKLVRPTQRALALHEAAARAFHDREAQLLSGFTAREREALNGYLDRVLKNLEQMTEEGQ